MPIANDISQQARARFLGVSMNMPLRDLPELMITQREFILMVTPQDRLGGIISRRGLISCFGKHGTLEMLTAGEVVETVYSCHVNEDLDEVWRRMFAYGWKSLPLLDEAGCPIGLVTARDVVEALIMDGADEFSLLRGYFQSF